MLIGSKLNWNDLLRLVITIRLGQVRPSTLLAKLSDFPRQNGLALALRDIGRINRSIFLRQWWQSPEMRRNVTAGLNKSEAQNTLARALLFNRLGELRDRTFESPFYRASGLNLLINVIVYWNTLYLEPAFADLNRNGIATPPEVKFPSSAGQTVAEGWQVADLVDDEEVRTAEVADALLLPAFPFGPSQCGDEFGERAEVDALSGLHGFDGKMAAPPLGGTLEAPWMPSV